MSTTKRQPVVRHSDDIAPVPCPCGQSTRIVTADDGAAMSLHVTHIRDGAPHFHELADEMYFIIEGEGHMELDGEVHPVRPGTAIYIPAGVTHRGWGDFKTVIVVNPAFDPDDEIVVGS